MTKRIESSGLLFLYIHGCRLEEREFFFIDTYDCLPDAFYRIVREHIFHDEYREDEVHIFSIIGAKEKALKIDAIIKELLKENYQAILSNKKIKKYCKEFDDTTNIFLRCIQECSLDAGFFLQEFKQEYEDFIAINIWGSQDTEGREASVVAGALLSWMEMENLKCEANKSSPILSSCAILSGEK